MFQESAGQTNGLPRPAGRGALDVEVEFLDAFGAAIRLENAPVGETVSVDDVVQPRGGRLLRGQESAVGVMDHAREIREGSLPVSFIAESFDVLEGVLGAGRVEQLEDLHVEGVGAQGIQIACEDRDAERMASRVPGLPAGTLQGPGQKSRPKTGDVDEIGGETQADPAGTSESEAQGGEGVIRAPARHRAPLRVLARVGVPIGAQDQFVGEIGGEGALALPSFLEGWSGHVLGAGTGDEEARQNEKGEPLGEDA